MVTLGIVLPEATGPVGAVTVNGADAPYWDLKVKPDHVVAPTGFVLAVRVTLSPFLM